MSKLVERLKAHCESYLLKAVINEEGGELGMNGEIFKIIDPDILFDEEFKFTKPVNKSEYDGSIYEFCGRFYIQRSEVETDFVELKNIGEPNQKLPTESFLGIHSGYELMNGMSMYESWVSKAKFLGVKVLGSCERNTLSGAMDFQGICVANGIKPIIGVSFYVIIDSAPHLFKFYAKNFRGWQTLLKFNTEVNVKGEPGISLELLSDNREGIYIVADPKRVDFELAPDFIDYYQVDSPEFLNVEQDKWFIDNLEKFLKSGHRPIAIADAYYVEANDYEIRERIWNTAKAFDDKTKGQYFMNSDQYAVSLIKLFEEGNNSWIKLFKEAKANEKELIENCNFIYDTGTRHLPAYIMSDENKELYESNDAYFIHLLKEGLKVKNLDNPEIIIERLKREISVLQKGNVIDYFLSLHDIISFANAEDILVGIGRGSAGGSLVSYLLGIIHLNPLEFNLLFERFLNEGRMGELVERPAIKIYTDGGAEIILPEGTIVRVIRDGKEIPVYDVDLQVGDDIIRY